MLELEHSTGLRPTPGPILAPATRVSRSGTMTLCCTPALSSSLARAAAWCGATRMSRLRPGPSSVQRSSSSSSPDPASSAAWAAVSTWARMTWWPRKLSLAWRHVVIKYIYIYLHDYVENIMS